VIPDDPSCGFDVFGICNIQTDRVDPVPEGGSQSIAVLFPPDPREDQTPILHQALDSRPADAGGGAGDENGRLIEVGHLGKVKLGTRDWY
jgi:hypothetical protein